MSEQGLDGKLIKRAQNGDKDAFNALMLKYQHRIIKLIRCHVSDGNDAMDLAQETFMKAYKALHRFRSDCAFYTWLYRIAINTVKNNFVSKGRRLPDASQLVDGLNGEKGHVKLCEQDDPEQFLVRDQMEAEVAKVVDSLPEEVRMSIILRELNGMTYDQIAEFMECPIGTVRSRIYRAREAIDAHIKPLLENKS